MLPAKWQVNTSQTFAVFSCFSVILSIISPFNSIFSIFIIHFAHYLCSCLLITVSLQQACHCLGICVHIMENWHCEYFAQYLPNWLGCISLSNLRVASSVLISVVRQNLGCGRQMSLGCFLACWHLIARWRVHKIINDTEKTF